MKKIIVIATLVLSSLSFADNHANGNPQNGQKGNRPKAESKYSQLTEEQKAEFKTMKDSYTKEAKEMSLNMKEVDIKMEKELMKDKPNRLTINKLIDEKATYKVARDKKMMEFKLEAKEKYGMEFKRSKQGKTNNKSHRGNRDNNKGQQQNNK